MIETLLLLLFGVGGIACVVAFNKGETNPVDPRLDELNELLPEDRYLENATLFVYVLLPFVLVAMMLEGTLEFIFQRAADRLE